jgi:hypothetical protein
VLSSLVLVFYAGLAPALSYSSAMFEDGSHCVAYKAEKVSFLFKKDAVVGKNCDISAQVLPEVGGLYHIEVNVPVRSFNSGDSERDKDVIKILKGEERPELTFRTKAMNADQWRELFAKKEFDLDGELFIGQKSFPLKMRATYQEKTDGAEVGGIVNLRFQDLEMRPPSVGAGLVAKAKPELELHFHLVSGRILGADSIRLGSKGNP